jgi:hypothetical protein
VDAVRPKTTGVRSTQAHQLCSDWLGRGRVHKFAMVAEKQ